MRNREYLTVGADSASIRTADMAIKPHPFGMAALAALTAAVVALSATTAVAQTSPVQLTPGGRTIISLSENPTTGYVWRFDPQGSTNATIVNVTDLGFSRPQSAQPVVGAPGLHRWSVEGVRAGRARLLFVNSRPWEGHPVRQQTIAVEVR
jgi:inhibitor of cysteine peptidase